MSEIREPSMQTADRSPKVSVVIPLHNVEDYLQECLDSVRNQTLQDIEIICVNDGSTDRSPEILRCNAAEDPRVITADQENRGPSAARNTGMEHARGRYICFLDSDDQLVRDALQILYDLAESNQLDVLYYDGDSFYENPDLQEKNAAYLEYYHRKGQYQGVLSGPEMFVQMRRNFEYRSSVCLQLIRREFYLAHQLGFYEGILQEDNLFSLICILEAGRVMHTSQRLYLRRLRHDSIMTTTAGLKNIFGYVSILAGTMQYLSRKTFAIDISEQMEGELASYCGAIQRIFATLPDDERITFKNSLTIYQQQVFSLALNRKTKAQSDEMARLQREGARLQNRLAEMEKRNASLIQEKADLSRDRDALRHENASLRQKITGLEKQNAGLGQEITAIRGSLAYKTGRCLAYVPGVLYRALKKRRPGQPG